MTKPLALKYGQRVNNPFFRKAVHFVERGIEKATGISQVLSLYEALREQLPASQIIENFLARLRITYQTSPQESLEIPQTGPAVIVANHPFGGVEGVIMIDLLKRIRPDIKVMANYMLSRLTALHDNFIFVDPFGNESAKKRNLLPLRVAIDWVKNGGLLVVFPAGQVSHLHLSKREISDPEWNPIVARIIRRTGCPVVPVFFHGSNGWFFQLSGLLSPWLRTVQLPRQLYNKRGTCIRLEIGTLIPADKIRSYPSDEELLAYLRLRTYILSSREDAPNKHPRVRFNFRRSSSRKLEPVVPAVDPELLAQEVEALPSEQILVEHGDFLVGVARAQQVPYMLREIGRLREITFREVNEGTGKSIDLDRFDNYYQHLFTWNRAQNELVGAYRLVDANMVRKSIGTKGLYTHTLFDYKDDLLLQMGQTLELGRSFVRTEYQKYFNSLHLLWRGIARYVVRYPQYYGLFGTVSISADYDSVSRHLIVSFLRENKYIPELARLIRARNPLRSRLPWGVNLSEASFVVKDLAAVSELLAEIEAKQKSIPILLRQYLKLGGKLLGFNLDRNFGDVLDGLIYIDLRETEGKILERYMGRDGAQSFFRYHGKEAKSEQSEAMG